MIDLKKYREDGYIYESIENYSDLINFEEFKKLKSSIDNEEFKIPSRYDYWYKYKDLSYTEETSFKTFIKKDDNIECAKYVFDISHKYQIDKMKRPEFYPTWVFGTSENSKITEFINSKILSDFQENFVKHYYSDKLENYIGFENNTKLQFYDEGCEIKLHDDGQPKNRLCVFLYFLNDEWPEENGGHLILYTTSGKIKIEPVFPNFVVLDSDVNLFHEVKMVTNGTKYNIVCFYSIRKSND